MLLELRAAGAPRPAREPLYPAERLLAGFVAPGLPVRWYRHVRDSLPGGDRAPRTARR